MKAYIFSLNPLDSADGKWDFGLLKETFERNKVEMVTVNALPEDDRAFVVIPGGGNAGKEKEINKNLSNIKRVVLFITGDECGLFNVDLIGHRNIEIWIQCPHAKHDSYNRFFLGAPSHIKKYLPNYDRKDYDVFFAGQITHQRRQELASIMPRIENALYRPTEGFAQGDPPDEYYRNMMASKVAPAPSGAAVIDNFRFYEALEMLALPIGDKKDANGSEVNFYEYVFGNEIPVPMIKDWRTLPDKMKDIMKDYPANMHQAVAWWIKYKRDFSIKIMRQVYAS